ncbi:hypothetical protein os1_05930 [Comamonadaceae bacterium OS-1]|nr:hypothetical protein os1_05930 [Comamonadaceae bacterium OS-1]
MHTNALRRPRGWLYAISMGLAVLVLSLLLDACGGGLDVAGVGSGGTGVASGTVSGFGSVIVDGVEYADTSATVQRQDASGSLRNTDVALGQRVRLTYQTSNTAQAIEVVAQLIGPVSAAPDANGWMQVLGQWVRVVNTTLDPTRSDPTVLAGYGSSNVDVNAIASADPVEVFGTWVWDGSKSAYVLVATRIEKLAAMPDPVQLGGVVQGLSSIGFRLNAPSGTLVQSSTLPTGLANGQVVQVWTRSAATSPVIASRVLRSETSVADLASQQSLRLGGLATQYDAVTRTVVVQGTAVQLASGVVVDTAALARGEFVSLQVQRVGDALVASAASVRSGTAGHGDPGDLGRTTVLMGVTSGIDWTASSVRFILRGVDVQATAATIASSCRSVPLASDVSVRVEGQAQAPGQPVTATQVTCSLAVAADAVVQRQGSVLSANTTTRSLVLRTAQGDISATWDSKTYFAQSPDTLVGTQVQAEGLLSGSTLQLRTVRLAP